MKMMGWMDRRGMWVAGGVVGVLAAAWAVGRLVGVLSGASGRGPWTAGALVVPWLMLMWVVATAGMIVLAAGGSGKHAWLEWGMVTNGVAVVLAGVAWDCGILTFIDVCKVYLLLAGWLAMWTGVVGLLRRWGSGVGGAVAWPMAASLVLLAGPVTLWPALRGVAVERQAGAVAVVAGACPVLGTFGAIHASVPFTWEQRDLMYGMTGLGQDVPMELPRWWVAAAVFAGAGGVMAVGGVARGRRTG